MNLREILEGTEIINTTGEYYGSVSGISYDSRKIEAGHLFVALRGEKADGHHFIADAIRRGASAVIYDEPEIIPPVSRSQKPVAFIQVPDSRRALASVANNYFGNPSQKLSVIGVTGTNGKTTTTYIIKAILEAWGKKAGLVGTIQYMVGDKVFQATHTTPESLEFQELLHTMVYSGATHAVCEVSSHALAQKRVDGTKFKTAVFTNFSRDHLDFHKTMENYFAAKERLFTELLDDNGYSVVNLDDPYGRRLLSAVRNSEARMDRVYTYGLETGADMRAAEIHNAPDGLKFKLVWRGRKYNVFPLFMGLPNVYNILAAAAAAVSLGVPWDVILEGIAKAGLVKGRFEKVDAGQDFLAFVDYAHTEDAMERLIYTARGLTQGKIITVFGCGGDRDRGKRPKMGSVATRLSDFVIITSDNPRSENPEQIISEIVSGAERKNYLIEPDREKAIKRAVMFAADTDVVLIAGKGHESFQEVEGKRYPFSDREVLEEAIRQLINNR